VAVIYDPSVAASISTLLNPGTDLPAVILYVGPDQLMPVASVLGAIVGLALMFWNKLLGVFRKVKTVFARAAPVPRKEPID